MAISTVRVLIDGAWHTLTYNGSTGKYEKTITAPNITSYNVNAGHYYPVTVEVTNTAGTVTTVNDNDPVVGNSLKLFVKENVKPTITISSPGAGAYVTNNKQPIVFLLRDEANGSGVNINSLQLKIDGGTAIGNGSPGMTCPPILNITNPSDDFITNNPSMVVQGTTNDSTSSPVTITIKLNGVDQGPVTVTDGSFSKSITLAEGSNTIEVKATDSAGKMTTRSITGTLDTSVPQILNVSIEPNPVDAGSTMVISVEVSG